MNQIIQRIKLYSYLRFSSKPQELGSTLDRQRKVAIDLAEKHNLELVEILDAGVSAFKGKNAKEGELGAFIAAVEAGVISSDSWLCVENLDRLSRANIFDAEDIFKKIIRLGITIVTPREVLNLKIIKEQPYIMMMVMTDFIRANDESETKSIRTLAAVTKRINDHETIRSPEGYAQAIEGVGNNVWWSKKIGNWMMPHPVYYPVAQQIIQMLLDGYGVSKITQALNKGSIKPPQHKKKKNADAWNTQFIGRFSKCRTLLGEKKFKIKGIEYHLDNYYPALCTEREFAQMQAIRISHRGEQQTRDTVGIVSGVGVLKCGYCEGPMVGFTHSFKKDASRTTLRYGCSNGHHHNSDCNGWSMNSYSIEDTVIRICMDKLWKNTGVESCREETKLIEAMELQLSNLNQWIDTGNDKVLKGIAPDSLCIQIQKLEQDRKDLINEIREARIEAEKPKETPHDLELKWKNIDPAVLDRENSDLRREVRSLVKESFKTIHVFKIGKTGTYRFVFKFIDGTTREVIRKHSVQFKWNDLEIVGDVLADKNPEEMSFRMEHMFTWGTVPNKISDIDFIYSSPTEFEYKKQFTDVEFLELVQQSAHSYYSNKPIEYFELQRNKEGLIIVDSELVKLLGEPNEHRKTD